METSKNKRMTKNTIELYIRMIYMLLVQLYTVPVILRNLGIEDFGIYNVVGGIVTLFSFVGGSLSSGAQRYIAYAIGKEDKEETKKLFGTTLLIYTAFSIVIGVFLIVVGLYFIKNHMVLDPSRLETAKFVFFFTLSSFIINLLTIPFNATVIAHEKMTFFSRVSIFESTVKTGIAISLNYQEGDKLYIYSSLLFCSSILTCVIYVIYCKSKFEECENIEFVYDTIKGKNLLTYSGWNIIGSIALIARTQGTNLIINTFFGPALNAAHSIGVQANSFCNQFVNNIYMATRPQITKQYAKKEMDSMWNLVFHSNKLAYFLLIFLTIPIIIEIPKLLDMWLTKPPKFTVMITRFFLIGLTIETLTNQLIGAFQAQNKIKKYQLYASSILLANIPLTYITMKYVTLNEYIPYVISTILSIIYIIAIIAIAKIEINLNYKKYIKEVLCPCLLVSLVIIPTWMLTSLFEESIIRIIITTLLSTVFLTITIWCIGLDKTEKQFITNILFRNKKIKI